MLRKSILIGLFVLKNNRTIGGPKSLQGGQERQLSSHAFSRLVTAGTGNWGWVFSWRVTAGTGVNGLKSIRMTVFQKLKFGSKSLKFNKNNAALWIFFKKLLLIIQLELHVTKVILDYHESIEIGGCKEHNITPFLILTPSVRRLKIQGM